eukprot:3545301-Amphidinium_carterae.1
MQKLIPSCSNSSRLLESFVASATSLSKSILYVVLHHRGEPWNIILETNAPTTSVMTGEAFFVAQLVDNVPFVTETWGLRFRGLASFVVAKLRFWTKRLAG